MGPVSCAKPDHLTEMISWSQEKSLVFESELGKAAQLHVDAVKVQQKRVGRPTATKRTGKRWFKGTWTGRFPRLELQNKPVTFTFSSASCERGGSSDHQHDTSGLSKNLRTSRSDLISSVMHDGFKRIHQNSRAIQTRLKLTALTRLGLRVSSSIFMFCCETQRPRAGLSPGERPLF